jgi:hypothetical protein
MKGLFPDGWDSWRRVLVRGEGDGQGNVGSVFFEWKFEFILKKENFFFCCELLRGGKICMKEIERVRGNKVKRECLDDQLIVYWW